MFQFQSKLWGFLLRHLFGTTLGTGDYGHLTIDHSAMLLRLHRSFSKYSNQGFEASHKVHRALYSRATCHDQGGVIQSCKFAIFFFTGTDSDLISIYWSFLTVNKNNNYIVW